MPPNMHTHPMVEPLHVDFADALFHITSIGVQEKKGMVRLFLLPHGNVDEHGGKAKMGLGRMGGPISERVFPFLLVN